MAVEQLQEPAATSADTATLLAQVYASAVPDAVSYQGILKPQQVEQVRALRLKCEQDLFRIGLMRLRDEQPASEPEAEDGQPADAEATDARSGFELREIEAAELPDGFTYEIMLDGKPRTPPDDMQGVMASILQDLGRSRKNISWRPVTGPTAAPLPATNRSQRMCGRGPATGRRLYL